MAIFVVAFMLGFTVLNFFLHWWKPSIEDLEFEFAAYTLLVLISINRAINNTAIKTLEFIIKYWKSQQK